MTNEEGHDSRKYRCAVWAALGLALGAAACGSDHGGLGSNATTGDVGTGAGGTQGTAGTSSAGNAGSGTAGTESGGAGTGGANATDDAGDAAGTNPEEDSGPTLPACIFHTEAPASDGGVTRYALQLGIDGSDDGSVTEAGSVVEAGSSDATAPSEGGPVTDSGSGRDATPRSDAGASPSDAGPAPSITVLVSPFLGPYLADSAGRTLFTYGGDMAGDCNYQPISGCEADCVIAWPVFYAGARTLAPGLNDGAFGTIQRPDFTYQTTYHGWPLYYFKTDVTPGMLGGQAKSKTWHAATVIPAGLVIMKDAASLRYIADGTGRTLYVYDQDTKGTATSDPSSACGGTCLTAHPSFWRNRISVVSSLEPTDFSTFAPTRGQQQLAYKGAPLYSSAADARSGDVKGATTGWSVALP